MHCFATLFWHFPVEKIQDIFEGLLNFVSLKVQLILQAQVQSWLTALWLWLITTPRRSVDTQIFAKQIFWKFSFTSNYCLPTKLDLCLWAWQQQIVTLATISNELNATRLRDPLQLALVRAKCVCCLWALQWNVLPIFGGIIFLSFLSQVTYVSPRRGCPVFWNFAQSFK